MQEFLSLYSNIENPTIEMVAFTYLLAFLLSVLIAATYTNTTPNSIKTTNFIQALILSALISATVVQSTNNSLASGVGLLGALTIIQFRSTFRDPRDVIFIFASISAGISCGSFVFIPAVIGSIGFCLVAALLRFTPFTLGNHVIWELKIRTKNDKAKILKAESILDEHAKKWTTDAIKNDNLKTDESPYFEVDYIVVLKDDTKYKLLLESLEAHEMSVRRFNKQNSDFTTNN